MKVSVKYWRSSMAVVMVFMALIMSAPMVFADNINPGVLAIDAKLGGQTYGQWSENWWQWAYSVTTPNFDDCPNQSGRMWFLTGAVRLITGPQTPVGSQPTETTVRNCTVPAGKNIMFPVFNFEQSIAEAEGGATTGNLPGSTCPLRDVNGNLITGTDYDSLLRCAQAFTQHVFNKGVSLGVEVNGHALKSLTQYRAASPSPLFPFTAVKGNPIGLCELLGSCPLPTKAASDGFWIILGPDRLPHGMNTIHFTASVPFPEPNLNFTYINDVTYNLMVK